MSKIFYARVSSKDQNLARQLADAEKVGADKVFSEKVSGKNTKDRTQLLKLLDFIREGDEVIVTSLDRLGRNNADLTDVLRKISDTGATFRALDLPSFDGVENPNLKRLLNNLILEVYKYQAEAERAKILERQKQGIAVAKSKGKYRGRPKKFSDKAEGTARLARDTAIDLMRAGDLSMVGIAKKTGISRSTLYRIKRSEGL